MTITTIDRIRFADPPNKPYVLRGTMRLNTSTFPDKTNIYVKNPLWENSKEANAGNLLDGSNPKYFQTQVETVARMGTGWDLVEVIAYIPQSGNQDTQKYEIVYDDLAGAAYLARRPQYDKDLLGRLTNPENLVFRVKLKDVETPVAVPISVGGFSKLHRRGKVMITAKNFAKVPNNGGELQWWWTIHAGSPQARLTLNWHNGDATPTGDVVFEWAMLDDVGSELKWFLELLDPAVDFFPARRLVKTFPPASFQPLTVSTNEAQGPVGDIVPATGENSYHILPMRMERSWRLVVSKTENSTEIPDKTWGITDSWDEGGYFPDDVGVDLSNIGDLKVSQHYATDLSRLLSTAPTGAIGASGGSPPVNFMWPARGGNYGGVSGGFEMVHFEGCRWLASGKPEGRLLHMIDMLRYRSRHVSCIYQDSEPIIPDDFTSPAGTATWKMFNKYFEKDGGIVRDDPFDYKAFQSRGTPFGTGAPDLGFTNEAAYSPQVFDPMDDQHAIRQYKSSMALVWMDNDPLAKQYITSDAAIARMSYWEGPTTYSDGMIKTTDMLTNEVVGWGREHAFYGINIAFAYAINDDEWRANFSSWLDEFSKTLIQSQTNQTGGGFGAKYSGKVVMEPAFDAEMAATGVFVQPPDFWVQRIAEDSHLARAMWMIGQVVGGSRLDDNAAAIRLYGVGLWSRCWSPGTEGPYRKNPIGTYGGASPTRVPASVYAVRADLPAGLADFMTATTIYDDAYHVAASMGLARRAAVYLGAGTTEIDSALLAFANKAIDGDEARANISAWGIGQNGPSNSVVENYVASKDAIADLS